MQLHSLVMRGDSVSAWLWKGRPKMAQKSTNAAIRTAVAARLSVQVAITDFLITHATGLVNHSMTDVSW
jgi:hypothetical protein